MDFWNFANTSNIPFLKRGGEQFQPNKNTKTQKKRSF
jgi:hypothetical protein